MKIIFFLIEINATFIECYIAYNFILLLSNNMIRHSKSVIIKTIFLSCLLTLIISFLNTIQLFSLSTLAFSLIFICTTIFFIFHVNLLLSFSITGFYYLFISLLDFFYASLVGTFLNHKNYALILSSNNSTSRMIFLCIMKFVLVVLYLSIKNYINHIPNFRKHLSYFVSIYIFGLSGTLYLIQLTFKSSNLNTTFYWILFSVTIISIFSFFFLYIKYRDQEENKKILEMRNSILKENYDLLNLSYSQNSKIYHDLNNNLATIQTLIKEEHYSDCLIYISDMIAPFDSIYLNSITGNSSIDFILNYKEQEAHNQNIFFL